MQIAAAGMNVLSAHQGGVCEGDNDVGIKLIQHGALDSPHGSWVARQRRHSHLCDSQAGPQQAQRAARASPTQREDLRNLLVQQVCYLQQK